MADTANPVAREILAAVAEITGVPAAELKLQAPPRPEVGDYALGVFALAKAAGEPPPGVAARIAAALPGKLPAITSAAATGPFVNLRVDRAWATRLAIAAAAGQGGARLVPDLGQGAVVCIDYSSPNISKHLAYHHIRSTMLGHALVEIHRELGYRVVRINHLGDWGTTHGMLLAAYERWGSEYPTLDVTALNELYVRFRAAIAADASNEAVARAWFKRLEDGEPEARARWKQFRDVSLAEFEGVYKMLGIEFDDTGGESFYEDKMGEILAMLEERHLLSESEGAQVVQLEGEKTPLLIKTRDGTTLYATRDLAAALYRWRTYHFARSLYVVDRGQAMHFRQLFAALALLGFEWASRCEHVPFGLVRFGGKKTSTRGGASQSFLLKEVFAEAAQAVRPIIAENNPDLPPAELAALSEQVGIGAVVFGNVLPQRDKDVDFDLDKAVSLNGDSGPYLQYTHARCASIGRKAGGWPADGADLSLLTQDAEWAVVRRLVELGDHVARAAAACEPHVVAHYLLDLAGDFSRWYTLGNGDRSLRIVCDDPPLRAARLTLTRAVQQVLARGLAVLGISAPDVM
ncbi:MAG TPA: arginine--tRNA ligase [Kofleriaceae bacterium]|nr:arginine--tRNA ligase [Kofleriaceae bacterium]